MNTPVKQSRGREIPDMWRGKVETRVKEEKKQPQTVLRKGLAHRESRYHVEGRFGGEIDRQMAPN